jgi:hypothetical protein
MADDSRPPRGYSWAPFQEGNLVGARHGTRSKRLVSAKANTIRERLRAVFPIVASDLFAESFERYCTAQARYEMLDDYVMEKAEREGVEAVRPYLWTETTRAAANAQKFAQDCGLDPIGFAKLAKELGWAQHLRDMVGRKSLQELMERGRAIHVARGKNGDSHG